MAEPQETPIPWNDEAQIACAFSFQCPKTWNRLATTSDPTVRHCSVCDRAVHLALTEEDFRRYREPGMCLAVKVSSDNTISSTESFIVGRADLGDYRPHPLKPI